MGRTGECIAPEKILGWGAGEAFALVWGNWRSHLCNRGNEPISFPCRGFRLRPFCRKPPSLPSNRSLVWINANKVSSAHGLNNFLIYSVVDDVSRWDIRMSSVRVCSILDFIFLASSRKWREHTKQNVTAGQNSYPWQQWDVVEVVDLLTLIGLTRASEPEIRKTA